MLTGSIFCAPRSKSPWVAKYRLESASRWVVGTRCASDAARLPAILHVFRRPHAAIPCFGDWFHLKPPTKRYGKRGRRSFARDHTICDFGDIGGNKWWLNGENDQQYGLHKCDMLWTLDACSSYSTRRHTRNETEQNQVQFTSTRWNVSVRFIYLPNNWYWLVDRELIHLLRCWPFVPLSLAALYVCA